MRVLVAHSVHHLLLTERSPEGSRWGREAGGSVPGPVVVSGQLQMNFMDNSGKKRRKGTWVMVCESQTEPQDGVIPS